MVVSQLTLEIEIHMRQCRRNRLRATKSSQSAPGLEHSGFALLELLLCLACIVLLLQMFPNIWWSIVAMLDVRQWSRVTWFSVNAAFVLVLIAARCAPEVREALNRRRAAANHRKKIQERKQELKDRKARWERRILLF